MAACAGKRCSTARRLATTRSSSKTRSEPARFASDAPAIFAKYRRRRQWYAHAITSGRGDSLMASIRKEVSIAASPATVWDVVRDYGAVHTRFAPGFVVDPTLEEGA